MTLQVELVSPEGILYEGEAAMVTARTIGGGDLALMTGHVPFLGVLATHPVKLITDSGSSTLIAASRGFISINGDRVTVLSDTAQVASDIDVNAVEAELAAAREAVAARPDDEEAQLALRWAEVRLDVARGGPHDAG